MRTNIVIDDKLMLQAMKAAGARTKRETVEAGLKMLVRVYRQRKARKLRGAIHWEGSLDESRQERLSVLTPPTKTTAR
ncbi:MAG: type II toxin-antitoxin system VapB family antitoxin [Nitrospira sp.]|nr:MAG: type II toxin-antitoxin system VapB family antitoxin [Nitrospira sp.]